MSIACAYTRELSDQICDRIASGETLNEICRSEGIPPVRTIRRWVIEDRDGFAARYARARDMQLEFWGDEIKDLGDSVIGTDNNAAVSAAKLAADNRKWLLSKLRPDKYGDRLTHAGDAKAPVTVVSQIELVPVKPEPKDGNDGSTDI